MKNISMLSAKTVCVFIVLFSSAMVFGVQRFPPPQFETGYTIPAPTTPMPRTAIWDWIDCGLLLAALAFASYLTLQKRSRKWIAGLMVFSLLYFGFVRHGCVCAIGSIGNITLALSNSGYAVPAVVLVFFLLPLVFTLFFGRGFCAAVCPLGAIQDIVLVRPLRVPLPLESALRLAAYLYLATAVFMAATGGVFIICHGDPFVTLFRFNGIWNMWVITISFLLISLFVGRPYCRFFCPYGVILRQLGRLSRWRVKITPDECIQCRLCENACPYNAVQKPAGQLTAGQLSQSKRRLAGMILLLPLLAAAGGWIGFALTPGLIHHNPTIQLADRVDAETAGTAKGKTEESEQFWATGGNPVLLRNQADLLKQRIQFWAIAAGVFMGLVVGGKLAAVAVPSMRKEYEADRASCFACGRCFAYCPVEQARRQKIER